MRGTMLRMHEAGIDAEAALSLLHRIQVMPVFIAHPTDVARRVMHFKQRHIAHELELLDRLPLCADEASRGQQAILGEITALWQTDEVRRRKPTVLDEIKIWLDHYPDSLIAPLPGLYEDMAAAFREIYSVDIVTTDLPTVVRFGSWIGCDRDGNPYVGAESTREALQKARDTILSDYVSSHEELRRLITPSLSRVAVSPDIQMRLWRSAIWN